MKDENSSEREQLLTTAIRKDFLEERVVKRLSKYVQYLKSFNLEVLILPMDKSSEHKRKAQLG